MIDFNAITKSIQENTYWAGDKAKQYANDAKALVTAYATAVRENKTVKSFEEFAADYATRTNKTAGQAWNDVVTTAKGFMNDTPTGKIISGWAGKTWEQISQGAADIDQQSGGFFSKNKTGLITAIIAFIGGAMLTGNPLVGLLMGLVGGAATGYFADEKSSLKTLFAGQQPVNPPAAGPGQSEAEAPVSAVNHLANQPKPELTNEQKQAAKDAVDASGNLKDTDMRNADSAPSNSDPKLPKPPSQDTQGKGDGPGCGC